MQTMTGKQVIVTGATSGLGLATARGLAHQGASVTLISRDARKLEQTAAALGTETGARIDTITADLASIAATRKAAALFQARHTRLDVLVNNAGAVFLERRTSAEGVELTLALNHLGPFLLTSELLALLRATAERKGEARVVNVASGSHTSGMHWEDPQYEQRYNGFGAYGQSKCMNVLFTYGLARRLEGSGVYVNALDPGFVATGFGKENGWFSWLMRGMQRFARRPEAAAETSIYLASAPEVRGVTGKYFVNRQQVASLPLTYEEAEQERLWRYTQALVAGARASDSQTKNADGASIRQATS